MLEHVGPHRLRAGIAAPRAADRAGDEEQADPGHDQHARNEVEFVRPDLDVEHVEAAVGEIDQHRLIGGIGAAVPADPRGDVVDRQGDEHHQPLEAAEGAVDPLVVDRLALFVERRAHEAHVLGHGGEARGLGIGTERPCPVTGGLPVRGGTLDILLVSHRSRPWGSGRHRRWVPLPERQALPAGRRRASGHRQRAS